MWSAYGGRPTPRDGLGHHSADYVKTPEYDAEGTDLGKILERGVG